MITYVSTIHFVSSPLSHIWGHQNRNHFRRKETILITLTVRPDTLDLTLEIHMINLDLCVEKAHNVGTENVPPLGMCHTHIQASHTGVCGMGTPCVLTAPLSHPNHLTPFIVRRTKFVYRPRGVSSILNTGQLLTLNCIP